MFTIEKAIFLDFGHFFTHIEDSKTEIFVMNTYADFRHQGVRLLTKICVCIRDENFCFAVFNMCEKMTEIKKSSSNFKIFLDENTFS